MPDVLASSFADPDDICAFDQCKESGGTDDECFKIGDNGIGCWGDRTSDENGPPMCALPPEEWRNRWGNLARGKLVHIWINGHEFDAELRDTMPSYRHITNGCGLDLNPAACKAAGLKPGFKRPATWCWTDDMQPRGWFRRFLDIFRTRPR